VEQPVRDPLRKWYRPETWHWRRRVPTDSRPCKPKQYRPRRRHRTYSQRTLQSGTNHLTASSWRKRKKKNNKRCKELWRLVNRRPPRNDGWDCEESPEECFERVKSKVLHVPHVMFGLQYGVDIDELVSPIDPIRQFRILQSLSGPDVVFKPVSMIKMSSQGTGNQFHDALIAAAHLTNTLPTQLQRDAFVTEAERRTELTPRLLVELTRNRSIYFSNKNDVLPIVIDTGGSKSVSPVKSDFIGEIRLADVNDLQGLSGLTAVIGVRTVRWTI